MGVVKKPLKGSPPPPPPLPPEQEILDETLFYIKSIGPESGDQSVSFHFQCKSTLSSVTH